MRFEEAPVGSVTIEKEKVGGDDKTPPSVRTWTRRRLEGGRDQYGFVPALRISIIQVSHDGCVELDSQKEELTKVHWATPVQIAGSGQN